MAKFKSQFLLIYSSKLGTKTLYRLEKKKSYSTYLYFNIRYMIMQRIYFILMATFALIVLTSLRFISMVSSQPILSL